MQGGNGGVGGFFDLGIVKFSSQLESKSNMASLGLMPIPFFKHGEESVFSKVVVSSLTVVLMISVVVGVAFNTKM